ncbi:unnamed protein product, partial [Polarella glacialis]
AAEVTLSSYYFWSSLSEQPGFQDYFTEVDLLVWLVSTAVHDIGHPAVNNDFLVKTKSSLALRYHDRAVLENFHIATAFELMKEKGVALLDHNMPSPPSSSLRNRVVEIILATDMAVHKSLVEDFAKEVQRNKNRQDIDKLLLEKTFVHMADIGFTPIPLFDREKASHFNGEEPDRISEFRGFGLGHEVGIVEVTLLLVRISVLRDCLNNIVNAEKRGKRQVLIRPNSKVIIKFLQVMQKHGYIGDLEIIDDHRAGKIVVDLIGRINKCGVISPRFDVTLDGIVQLASDILPSRQFGHLVLTTPYGIMDHHEAQRKNTGGKIVGFFF